MNRQKCCLIHFYIAGSPIYCNKSILIMYFCLQMYKQRNQQNGVSNASIPPAGSPEAAQAAEVLEKFIAASTFKSVLHHHRQMCDFLKLRPTSIRQFYPKLRSKLKSWKAQALWTKFDKRASHKCYNFGKACANTKVI